jgi:probable phosphoglycerate mutase
MDAVRRIAQQHRGKKVMVVTHGGVLDMVWRTARGTGLNGPRQSDIPNAGLNRVRVTGDVVEVLDWADVRHLHDLPEQPVYDQRKLVGR